MDLVKFDMYTLVSRDYAPFCKYMIRYVYPGNQGTHDKLDQILEILAFIRTASLQYFCLESKSFVKI